MVGQILPVKDGIRIKGESNVPTDRVFSAVYAVANGQYPLILPIAIDQNTCRRGAL
jgi:hypothetical protein